MLMRIELLLEKLGPGVQKMMILVEVGLYSWREMQGYHLSNNLKLLKSLENRNQRNAAFVACLVFFDPNSNERPISAEGRLEGEIALNSKGKDGFGYDPIFLISGENKTLAELGKDYKNENSHRAKATKILLKMLLEEKS